MGLKGYTEIPPLWQILHVLAPVLAIFGISFYSSYSVVFLQKMCFTFYKEKFFYFYLQTNTRFTILKQNY